MTPVTPELLLPTAPIVPATCVPWPISLGRSDRIHRLAVVGAKIVAEDIVHKSIAVVIDPVIGDLSRILPHVGSQIRMIVGDAGVDHPNDHVGAAGGDIPGFRRIDINICRADRPIDGLPGIVKAPKRAELVSLGIAAS